MRLSRFDTDLRKKRKKQTEGKHPIKEKKCRKIEGHCFKEKKKGGGKMEAVGLRIKQGKE